MINKLGIMGLKCFKNEQFDLKNLTLLTGTNSAGKSTLIQAVLLVIQNITDNGSSPLNGSLVALGEFNEAKNFIVNAKTIDVCLESEDEKVTISIQQDGPDELKCNIQSVVSVGTVENINKKLNYSNGHINYISSDRIGIKDLYDKNYNKYEKFGIRGEYAFDYYNKYKSLPISEPLIKEKTISETLEGQINFWLKYILNCELVTEEIIGTDKIKTSYKYGTRSRAVRPKNIGTGLSYVISLMIVCLSAKKGDLIIIENPEIHLHPKAQSRITQFFAFVADKGVQLLIETHSDHIFNGVRKAVNKSEINVDDVVVYFFKIDEATNLSNPVKICLDSNGTVKNHQRGLFDQFDDDLDELLGL